MPPNKGKQDSRPYFLEVNNVSKEYATGHTILKDISFGVMEKEIVVLLGPSGCGKSTLLNIVNGGISTSRGEVLIRGKKNIGKNPYSVSVFQRTSCFPWLTVFENIEFSLHYGFWKLDSKSEANDRARRALKRVGLADYGDYYPHQISGGMQQRAALARSLVADAPLVLMDEPFVGLDQQTKELMHMLILDLWEENKKTLLLITHDLEEALFIADRIYVLSARPAQVKSVVAVDLPRPRKPEIKFNTEFIRLEKYLSFLTEREVIKASQVHIADIDPYALNIGLYTWIGTAPFYVAKELGLFEKYAVDVNFVLLEKNDDRTAALLSGEVDLIDSTLDRFLLDRSSASSLQIAALPSRSVGGDALLVRPEIKDFSDLRGKKIGVERGWVNDFFLHYVLDTHGMSLDDIERVDVKESDAGSAMLQNKVDGVVIWEPWLSNIQERSGGRILISTQQEPVLIDALVGLEATLQRRQEEITRLLKALFEATGYMRIHGEHSAEIVSAYLGMSPLEAEGQLRKVEPFTAKENVAFIGPQKGVSEFARTTEKLENVWMKETDVAYKRHEGNLVYTPHLFE
ncbi:ATP-binding cassette domain-containing protein [Candidatus Uhrbacteria bacterium]|nr:ATP-binding cassette domain-containing protein [Candidatus Uhrbacteria bacterium]